MKIPIVAIVKSINTITVDCSSISIRAKIVEGPDNFLDRHLELKLGPIDTDALRTLLCSTLTAK